MNRLKASVTSQIQRWASRQLADYDARQPGTMFAEGVVLDVAQGYELQSAVAQLRCDRGERIDWLQGRLHVAEQSGRSSGSIIASPVGCMTRNNTRRAPCCRARDSRTLRSRAS